MKLVERQCTTLLKAWSEKKLVGLDDEAGRGRKQIFNSQQKEEIRSWAKESPKNLKNILELSPEESFLSSLFSLFQMSHNSQK